MPELDRLAAAYHDSFVGLLERRGEDGEFEKDPTTFDELAGDDQELIRHGVRAILIAMREPSKSLTRTMGDAAQLEFDMHAAYAKVWRAAIDHLLGEPRQFTATEANEQALRQAYAKNNPSPF